MTEKPWPANDIKNWKNPERTRKFHVTGGLFAAVHASGPGHKDCMTIVRATDLRLTGMRTIRLQAEGALQIKTSRRGKPMRFIVADTAVLSAVVERRPKKVSCIVLLTTPTGRRVSARPLNDR